MTGEDVQAIFFDVCAHRIILSQEARLGAKRTKDILCELLRQVDVPDRRL